jgi:hypothetical protein
MQIRITRSFVSVLSPRPLLTNELLDLPDEIAEQFIADGHAQPWTLTANPTPPPPAASISPTPPKARRERATRP